MRFIEMLASAVNITRAGKEFEPMTLSNGLSLSVRPMTIPEVLAIADVDPELIPIVFIGIYMKIEGRPITKKQMDGFSKADMDRLSDYAVNYLGAIVEAVTKGGDKCTAN